MAENGGEITPHNCNGSSRKTSNGSINHTEKIQVDRNSSLFNFEEDNLLENHKRVNLYTAIKLRYGAIGVSWVSVILALIQGILALVLSSLKDSVTLFGFGLDALLDSASSMVILWRFHSNQLYSELRETRACIFIGFFLLLSSLFLLGRTVYNLLLHTVEVHSQAVWILSLVNGIINLVLAIAKILIGYNLESRSLMVDSVITFIGSFMSFAALGALAAYTANKTVWYLDSVFGLISSCFLLACSFKLLYDNTKPKPS